jgi:hypothetical protein
MGGQRSQEMSGYAYRSTFCHLLGAFMAISLIAALDENFAIGRKGQLPWHLPDDLKWFKQLTVGKYVLMGYNTAVSIGRTLPDRENLVLSHRHEAPFPGQITVRSIEEALARCNGSARQWKGPMPSSLASILASGPRSSARTTRRTASTAMTSTWSSTSAIADSLS